MTTYQKYWKTYGRNDPFAVRLNNARLWAADEGSDFPHHDQILRLLNMRLKYLAKRAKQN